MSRLPQPQNSPARSAAIAAALGAAVLLPVIVNRGLLEDFSRVFVLILAVLGVNLLTSTTGLISLGHGVFVGIGAFSMANLLDENIPVIVALVLATAVAGFAGMIVALPALRVRGPYLALITLGLSVIFPPIGRRLGKFTGSALGRSVNVDGFDPPDFLRLDDHPHIWNYVVCLMVVSVWFLLARNLLNSRIGRAIRASKDHEHAAAAFGVNLAMAKTGTFGISAAMAGTAGALQAIIDPYLNTNDYDWTLSLKLYTSAVIGGLGSLLGAVVGAVIYVGLPWLNEVLGLLDSPSLAFGLGLLIIIIAAPNGVVGLLTRFAKKPARSRRDG
ncbi:MAG: branched-chain amino acid transport system permease protein [Paracrocinitomix sp.]